MTTDTSGTVTRVRDDVGSYEDIAAAAVRTTGMDDLGGTDHEEGLRLLVEDLNAPTAGLTGEGRTVLQLIGLNDQDKRWVLRNPSHLVALDALMAVYPDPLVVQTHRDPVTSIASACSLSAEATAGWSTTFVGETIGRTHLEMLSRSHRSFVESRETTPGSSSTCSTPTSWPTRSA